MKAIILATIAISVSLTGCNSTASKLKAEDLVTNKVVTLPDSEAKHSNGCSYNNIVSEEFLLSDIMKKYTANSFSYLDRDTYVKSEDKSFNSLKTQKFKRVGNATTGADVRSAKAYLSKYRYSEISLDGVAYKMDKTKATTKIVTEDCTVYYANNEGPSAKTSFTKADGSNLSDAEFITFVGEQAFARVELSPIVKRDEFKGTTWVNSGEYKGTTLRGVIDNETGKLSFTQVYKPIVFMGEWGHLDHAYNTEKTKLSLTKIDTNVDCSSKVLGCVLTETVGVTIPLDFIQRNQEGFKLKAYGSREAVITIDKVVIESYFSGLEKAGYKL